MTQTASAPTATVKHPIPHLRPRLLLKRADLSTVHPTVLAEAEHRAASIQLRIADAITAFAGSMWFVYIHVALFAVWMLWVEPSPWPTLTLIVSLEAIFLSTFVMIGQNRQAAFQQAKADRDFQAQDTLLTENTELTRMIHLLSEEIHARVLADVQARQQSAVELPPDGESGHGQSASARPDDRRSANARRDDGRSASARPADERPGN